MTSPPTLDVLLLDAQCIPLKGSNVTVISDEAPLLSVLVLLQFYIILFQLEVSDFS